MRAKILISFVVLAALCMLPVTDAWGRGFGGFHGGGFGGGDFHASSFHGGGFSGGYGSVYHAGASHYGPATGFTHVGGTSVQGAGGSAYHSSYGSEYHGSYGSAGYASHGVNYGSISHYDSSGAYGHAFSTAGGYGAGAVHGPEGGSAAAYKTPYSSGVAVKGPAGNEAAAVKGPYGGTAAYHGPYSSGAVAELPSGYTAAAWHGTTYYHSGYTFYEPHWYGGSVYYYPTAAPAGWFFAALPAAAAATVIAGTTYYVADGVYYQPSAQNGQAGYVVVEAPAQATAAPAAVKAPDPFQSLQKFSEYMGKQKHFLLQVSDTYDEMAFAGDKIQLTSQRTIRVERPDKMSADITNANGDQKHIVFDGKEVTIVDQTKNTYGVIPAGGMLDAALDTLAQDYGMAQPAADLLYSDIYAKVLPKIKTGQFLGIGKIGGKTCDHFIYSQPNLSWQIWMDQGAEPVPRSC